MNPRFELVVIAACLLGIVGCGATEPLNEETRPDARADALTLSPDAGKKPTDENDAAPASDSGSPSEPRNPADSDSPADGGSPADAEKPSDAGEMTDAGTIDAGATVDAGDPPAPFDVVYIDEFTTAWNRTGLLGFLAIVNTGRKPLDLAKLSIVTYVDDDPGFDSTFEQVVSSTNYLLPGHIAGVVSPDGTAFLLERGFLTEPFMDDDTLFGITFHEHASPGTDLHALATLSIDDAEVVLPFAIHFVLEQVTRADHASRVHAHLADFTKSL